MATQHSAENHQVAQNEGSTTGVMAKLASDTAAGIDGKVASATSAEPQGVTADNRIVSKGVGFITRIIKNIASKITSFFTKKQDVQSRAIAENKSSMSPFETLGVLRRLKSSKLDSNKKLELLNSNIDQIPEKYKDKEWFQKTVMQVVSDASLRTNGRSVSLLEELPELLQEKLDQVPDKYRDRAWYKETVAVKTFNVGLDNNKKLELLNSEIDELSKNWGNEKWFQSAITRTVIQAGVTPYTPKWTGTALVKNLLPYKNLWNHLPEQVKNEFRTEILSDNAVNVEQKLNVLKEADKNGTKSQTLVQEFLTTTTTKIAELVEKNRKTKTETGHEDGSALSRIKDYKTDIMNLLMKVASEEDFFFQKDRDKNGNLDLNTDFRKKIDQFLLSAMEEDKPDNRVVHLAYKLAGTGIAMEKFISIFGSNFVEDYVHLQNEENLDTICQKMVENPSKIVDCFGKTGCCPIQSLPEDTKAKLLESLSKLDLSGDVRLQSLKMGLSWSGDMSVKEQSSQVTQLLNSLATTAVKPSILQDKLQEFSDFSREGPKVSSTILEAISTEDKLTQIAGQLDQVCTKLDQYRQSMQSCADAVSVFEASNILSFENGHPCRDFVGLAMIQGAMRMHDTYGTCIEKLEKFQKVKEETGADPNNEKYKAAIRSAVNGEMELGNVLSEQNSIYQMRNLLVQHYDTQSNTINGVSKREVLTNAPNAKDLANLFGNPDKVDLRAAMQAAGLSLS